MGPIPRNLPPDRTLRPSREPPPLPRRALAVAGSPERSRRASSCPVRPHGPSKRPPRSRPEGRRRGSASEPSDPGFTGPAGQPDPPVTKDIKDILRHWSPPIAAVPTGPERSIGTPAPSREPGPIWPKPNLNPFPPVRGNKARRPPHPDPEAPKSFPRKHVGNPKAPDVAPQGPESPRGALPLRNPERFRGSSWSAHPRRTP